MSIDILKRALLFTVFLVVQVLVLGRIHLFHCATPLLYVYFVTLFPRNYSKAGILLWSFLLGAAVDIFSNTPGVAAASLTLIGALQPYWFEVFVPRDSVEDLKPSMANIGPVSYFYYVLALLLVFCAAFFSLEMFSFFNWLMWIECVVGSTAVTLILIMTFESVKGNKKGDA